MTSSPETLSPVQSPSFAQPPRLRDRLLFRQGIATFLIAFLSSTAISLWAVSAQWQSERVQIAVRADQDLALVQGAATEAAFQLSRELASRVTQALVSHEALTEAAVTDNFGEVLSSAQNPPHPFGFKALAQAMFGDQVFFSKDLVARGIDGSTTAVGKLSISLDPDILTRQFFERMQGVLILSLIQVIIVCVLVAAVFHHLITKPLLSLTRAIARVDPGHPGGTPIPVPAAHLADELGILSSTLNHLLQRSQGNLDGRDQAEAELSALARDLEHRVAKRTADLEKANRSIGDGIRYAARLQGALLPPMSSLEGVVREWCVGWNPLDGVGGDLYWAGKFDHLGVIALMDCTGHGVPGAFMSAVASSVLNRVLNHIGHEDPAKILSNINLLMKAALHQDGGEGGYSNDGLDAAICVIDPQTQSLRFAGAGLSLHSISPTDHHQWRGDRFSLGYPDSRADFLFTTHEISYASDQTFYLYTDGITDQVGGPNGRLIGKRRVHEILAPNVALPLEAQKDALFDGLAQWRGEQHRRDDMTFLAFRPVV